ncbi:type II CAAX endopeptidase family protein [Microbacterium sp. H1-D42]|uniref:CPBP family intramembrane glutamic endopeptidase n=1 Tax=Microbacterium sp. H1-D42 TaxID=2925844 RepID=UPI001F534047|nr:type II CAAX endopeptidase family protein [Microbacterium sp. H1-D42]UNK71803.1 CPBP family intramembrane metalloprotease [Microbacterium sp. H1-D42]
MPSETDPTPASAPHPAVPPGLPLPPPPPPAPEVVESVEYHRLNIARGRRPRWWRPLLVALLGVALYLAMTLVLIVPLAFLAVFVPEIGAAFQGLAADPAMLDMNDPMTFTATMLSIILLLPALLIASRIVAGRGLGLLSSVDGRLRWGWMLRGLGIAVVVFVLGMAIQIALSAIAGQDIVVSEGDFQAWPMLLLVILLVPLQATTEEYVFRGFLMQAIGSWLRHPAFAILLPLPLFVFGHLYDVWGLLSVGAFALAAGWLTWRTGGLEAAIALHIVNNVGVFVLAALGLVDANSSGGGAIDLLASVVVLAASVAALEWAWRRSSLARIRTLRWPAAAPIRAPHPIQPPPPMQTPQA